MKQITRHEIHVFNNEMDGSFLRTLALLVCESFGLYKFPRIHMIVSRLNGKWAFAVQLFVRWTVAIIIWEILKIMLWKHLMPMDAFAARKPVICLPKSLTVAHCFDVTRKSVGKFSIDGKLVELGLGIPSMETFPRLNKNSSEVSFPRWKICWVRLDIPSMEIFLNRWNLHRWIYIYIYIGVW